MTKKNKVIHAKIDYASEIIISLFFMSTIVDNSYINNQSMTDKVIDYIEIITFC